MNMLLSNLQEVLPNTINVVGNAQSLLDSHYGEQIDKHPTIRFNRTEIINPMGQGNRWDFLASNEVNTFLKYNKEQPKFHSLIFTPKTHTNSIKIRKANFNVRMYSYPLEYSYMLTTRIGKEPSTGIQILYLLQKFNHRQVNIFGFDWKATPTFYEDRNKGDHDFEAEKEIVLGMAKLMNWKIY